MVNVIQRKTAVRVNKQAYYNKKIILVYLFPKLKGKM